MIKKFNKYFKKEQCDKIYGAENGKFFVSWATFDYTNDDQDEIIEEKWSEVLDFVLDNLLSGMSFKDLILESDENMERIARDKLKGFTVMTNIDLNDDSYNEVLLALTFYNDSGYEDRCHIAINSKYANAILAEAKRLVLATDECVEENDAELEKFKDKCYSAYQLYWMFSHSCSIKDLIDGVSNYAAEYSPKAATVEEIIQEATCDFISNNGFGGSMWVCKEEFLETEFLDHSYMYCIFANMLDGEALKEQYCKLVL